VSVLNTTEIMDLIPNRFPILYIDKVDELVPGEKIVATKNVTINENYFQGHFPGNPVMPGVLIIESMAQVASILILKSEKYKDKTAYLGEIKKAKFRKIVRPGDVIRFEVTMGKQKSNMGMVDCTAYVGDKKACQAELTFIVPNEKRK
jgi:3-hydroxyacyl-[acyl-carrier-protein] dehydratase